MARIVTVPDEVKARFMGVDEDGKPKFIREQGIPFAEFVRTISENHPFFRAGQKGARMFDRIMTVLEAGPQKDESAESADAKPILVFEDEDYAQIEEAAKGAQWSHPAINRAVLPFYDAIKDAQEVKTVAKTLRKV